jgi:integrase
VKKRAATQRTHFTERRLAALVPGTKRRIVYDGAVRKLGLKIEPGGRKTFFWWSRVPEEDQPDRIGKATWRSIGDWPQVSLDTARAKAEEYNVLLANWRKDGCKRPSPFRVQRSEMTLDELAEDYFSRHLRAHAQHPEKQEREARYKLNTYLSAWKDRRLSTISRMDVSDLHAKLGKANGHYAANATVELVSRLYNFAINQELFVGANPARGLKRFHERKRTRFVERDEMPKLFAALQAEQNRDVVDFVHLSLWSGARKNDVLSMRWADVSLSDHRWLVPDPKGRQPYQIALVPEAVAILQSRKNNSDWVFPSNSRSGHVVDLKRGWKRLLFRAGITNLRQHDLRRTLASWQAGQGTSLIVIGKTLGHRSLGATEIYSQIALDAVRESVTSATQAIIEAGKKRA